MGKSEDYPLTFLMVEILRVDVASPVTIRGKSSDVSEESLLTHQRRNPLTKSTDNQRVFARKDRNHRGFALPPKALFFQEIGPRTCPLPAGLSRFSGCRDVAWGCPHCRVFLPSDGGPKQFCDTSSVFGFYLTGSVLLRCGALLTANGPRLERQSCETVFLTTLFFFTGCVLPAFWSTSCRKWPQTRTRALNMCHRKSKKKSCTLPLWKCYPANFSLVLQFCATDGADFLSQRKMCWPSYLISCVHASSTLQFQNNLLPIMVDT